MTSSTVKIRNHSTGFVNETLASIQVAALATSFFTAEVTHQDYGGNSREQESSLNCKYSKIF